MLVANKFTKLLLTLLLLVCAGNMYAQNIEIDFAGIRSTHGQIVVKVFTNEQGFHDDKAIKTMKFKKTDVVNGRLTEKLSLEPGVYGFALLDDENDNGAMDNNMLGMPKEGFGFSNFYLSGMKRPKFEQFKFNLAKNQQLKIEMKLRYL